jgi:hypothetical protein
MWVTVNLLGRSCLRDRLMRAGTVNLPFFISSFNRQWPFREPIADPKSVSPIWAYPASRPEASPRVGSLAHPALGQFCNPHPLVSLRSRRASPRLGLRVAAYGHRTAELLALMRCEPLYPPQFRGPQIRGDDEHSTPAKRPPQQCAFSRSESQPRLRQPLTDLLFCRAIHARFVTDGR